MNKPTGIMFLKKENMYNKKNVYHIGSTEMYNSI